MNFSKKMLTSVLALAVSSMMSVSAFAAEPVIAQDETGETVYTQTINFSDSNAVSYGYGSQSKTVTSYRSLGLALDAGESGTSLPATFRFSLPSNAKVRSVKVNPGRATINNGKRGMIGAVVFSSINVKSPYGTSINGKWSPREMDFSSRFLNEKASGTWEVSVTGQNIASPPSNMPWWAPSAFGSLVYKSPSMTITYVLG